MIFRLLVAVYVLVSIVAYTDFPRRATDAPLTAREREGLAVWRRHNCQACHQIYGFGGFFGPDLTNRVTEETQDREFLSLFKTGRGRMPPLGLSHADQASVLAYLRAVDRTGRSQPRPLAARRAVKRVEHLRLLADAWSRESTARELDPAARRGCEEWTGLACGSCHIPFTVGPTLAPDVTAATADRSLPALRDLLPGGRGKMPSYPVQGNQIEALHTFLEWTSAHRAELVGLNDRMLYREEFAWNAVPWFEYR